MSAWRKARRSTSLTSPSPIWGREPASSGCQDVRRRLDHSASYSLGGLIPEIARLTIDPKGLSPGTYKDGIVLTSNAASYRSEEHTSELQSLRHLVCRLLLEK